ncbi:hypothetical protein Q5O_20700 [Pseudomonas putida JB]|uniref:hypothetical protein n=1 Tax=Pseudomonas putida TaxID=303 RepID=UPI000878199F|nr:hypothetical protein [Pseudomonas putida]AOX10701.1 hypothetical protein Q5O_20700 [Pseudomonas putida JB]
MQPHQYALAAGIGWMVTLIILPFLIAKARQRAYALGFEAGKACNDQALHLQLKDAQQAQDDLRTELQRTKQTCALQLETGQDRIVALQSRSNELEAQILSYTGMPVTRSDYENLRSASATMRLAQRTFRALKSQPESDRAATQAAAVDELAQRIHAQLREIADTTPAAGAAA